MQIEQFGALKLQLGECPLWDAQQQKLWLMDCRRGHLYALSSHGDTLEQHLLPAPTGSFALNHDGRIVVAMKEAIGLYNPQTRALSIVAELDTHLANLRINDGTALPDGRFLAGSMHINLQPGEAPEGGIYVVGHQGQLRKIGPALKTANGPLIHPRTGRLFICDSAEQTIFSFDIRSGTAQDRQVFASTQALNSAPDGCCFDSAGGLWTALVRTGELARFDADGSLSLKIAVPVAHPSALCFGGPQLDQLFVTSIADSGRLRADGALDGGVLKITGHGYSGLPEPRCTITPAL